MSVMGRLLLLCLILAEVLMVQGMPAVIEGHSEMNPSKVGTEVEPQGVVGISDPPAPSAVSLEEERESEIAEAPEIRRLGKHHSSGKSVAGGGVIIGGLATATFAAVFCYIRVTRRRKDNI